MRYWKSMIQTFLIYEVVIFFTASIAAILPLMVGLPAAGSAAMLMAVVLLWYLGLRKRLTPLTVKVNAVLFALWFLVFTIGMICAKGNVESTLMVNLGWVSFPFVPLFLLMLLTGNVMEYYVIVLLASFLGLLFSMVFQKYRLSRKKAVAALAIAAILAAANTGLYQNRPQARYGGHGFEYMSGYSSTDFSDYLVTNKENRLARLEKPVSFLIEQSEEMPVMDGAEACYPLYAAVAQEVYADIAAIEDSVPETEEEKKNVELFNGKIVQFSNTVVGLERLIMGETDLFFGAMPSANQRQMAAEMGVELEITPIGKEGFVFFVEKDNPVDDLSADQIREIYHGDLTNWSEVGGKNQKILAFQRPQNSGSQTMMEYFMGEVSLKEPESYETYDSMAGVIRHVAQYANEKGAMGYSFRYFLEELNQEEGVKLLSIDGIAPTVEHIEEGTYPLTVNLCLITRKNDENPNVQKMITFMLSEQGQELVRKTGYAGVEKE